MDTDKVIQDLNRRFAAPLPEFYQRRIIFWYDEDKEFEDKLDEVVLENAKVIALTGNNAFSVKKLLLVDDLATNYLVYSPLAYNRPEDNWLLDVELYSEEFRADLISIWMDEMGTFTRRSHHASDYWNGPGHSTENADGVPHPPYGGTGERGAVQRHSVRHTGRPGVGSVCRNRTAGN